jgi:hypothetical protein
VHQHDRRSARFLARRHAVNGGNTQLQHCATLYTTISTAPQARRCRVACHLSPHSRAHYYTTRESKSAQSILRSILPYMHESRHPAPYAMHHDPVISQETANIPRTWIIRWMPPLGRSGAPALSHVPGAHLLRVARETFHMHASSPCGIESTPPLSIGIEKEGHARLV